MLNNYYKVVLTIFFLVVSTFVFAQPGPPGGGGDPGCWPPDACVPIDTGIGFLIAAAVAYGSKKTGGFFSKKNKE